MDLDYINNKLNEMRMAAFTGNEAALDTLRKDLAWEFIRHVSEAGDDDLRTMAFAILNSKDIEVLG